MPKGKRKFYTVEIIDKKLSMAEYEGEDQLRNFLGSKNPDDVMVFTGKHLPIRSEVRLVIGDGARRGRPPGVAKKAKK